MREAWVRSLGQEDSLEKEMATHSSILVWKIPWTEEPGGLQSMGSQRVGHDWATSLSLNLLIGYISCSLKLTIVVYLTTNPSYLMFRISLKNRNVWAGLGQYHSIPLAMSLKTLRVLESIHIMEVSLLGPWSLPLSILLCAQSVLTAEDCITRVSHLPDSVFSRPIGGTLQEGQGKGRKRIIHLFLISSLHQYWISGSSWDAPQLLLC